MVSQSKVNLQIIYAELSDLEWLVENDTHIKPDRLEEVLQNRRIIVAKLGEETVGWLRYGYFWDYIPFMNRLTVTPHLRGKGIGHALTMFWEQAMQREGHEVLFTSSYSHERGQHFYRKMGYKDIGGFILPQEPLELIFMKQISLNPISRDS